MEKQILHWKVIQRCKGPTSQMTIVQTLNGGKAKCAIREKKKEIAFSQGSRKPEKLEELDGRELLFFVCTLDNFAQIGSKRSNLQLNSSVLCIAEKTWNNAGYGKEQSEGHRDKRRALAGNPKLE